MGALGRPFLFSALFERTDAIAIHNGKRVDSGIISRPITILESYS